MERDILKTNSSRRCLLLLPETEATQSESLSLESESLLLAAAGFVITTLLLGARSSSSESPLLESSSSFFSASSSSSELESVESGSLSLESSSWACKTSSSDLAASEFPYWKMNRRYLKVKRFSRLYPVQRKFSSTNETRQRALPVLCLPFRFVWKHNDTELESFIGREATFPPCALIRRTHETRYAD